MREVVCRGVSLGNSLSFFFRFFLLKIFEVLVVYLYVGRVVCLGDGYVWIEDIWSKGVRVLIM